MEKQSAGAVIGVLIHQQDLVHHVIEDGGFIEHPAVVGEKRRAHVEAVEPHLKRIPLFVPEPTIACPRLVRKLSAQDPGRGFEPFVPGFHITIQNDTPRDDHVDVVVRFPISGDPTVGPDERDDQFRCVVRHRLVAGLASEFAQRMSEQSAGVFPARGGRTILEQRFSAALDLGIGESFRPLHRRGSVKFLWHRLGGDQTGNPLQREEYKQGTH